MARVGFLHTADAHVESFDLLMNELAPSLERQHVVRPALLQRAQLVGESDRQVRLGVCAAISAFREPTVILCTCSTIGSIAEHCGRERDIRVLRVDRPMAELAVRSGRKIAIIAALASTLAPTRALLESVAREARVNVELVDVPCLDAWALFQAGDHVHFTAVLRGTSRHSIHHSTPRCLPKRRWLQPRRWLPALFRFSQAHV